MSDNAPQVITVLNMTGFFNRELFMSALGDIKLSKPISLKKMAYIMLFLIIWTLPMVLIFPINWSLPYLVLLIAPPFLLGNFAAKPVWGGKNLVNFLKGLFQFISEPSAWADLKPVKVLDDEDIYVEYEVWISRRAELQQLYRERKLERELQEVSK